MAANQYLTGDDALVKKLEGMSRKIQRKAIRKANGKAARPIVRDMKARARKVSKTISKGIGLKNKVYLKDFTGVVVIGVRDQEGVVKQTVVELPDGTTIRRKHDPRNTFRLVDLGTKPHRIKVFGKHEAHHPGTPPRDIRKDALNSNERKAVAIYSAVFREEVLAGARAKS